MPQPIDPSSELGRLSAAERVQMTMERAAQMAQLRMADDADKDTVRLQEQAQQARQKEAQVDEQLKRRNPFMGRRRKQGQSEQQPDESLETYNARLRLERGDDQEHRLDVTL